MTPFTGARHPTSESVAGAWCVLEPLDPEAHAAGLRDVDLAGDDETWRWLPYGPFTSGNAFRDHLERLTADPELLVFAVMVQGAPCGVLSFLNVVPPHGTIEIGHIWFSRSLQRTTPATEALFLLMREAFALGNRRLEWKANAENRPSCAAAERLGFTFEGIFRQHYWIKGRNRDTAWYSLLDREWPAVRAAFERWLDPASFDADGRQRAALDASSAAAAARPASARA